MIKRRDRNGKIEEVRPNFEFAGPSKDGTWTREAVTAQLMQDARDVLEQIRDSQMLQCSVARAINSSAEELRRCRIALEKIARRKRRGNQSKPRRKT